MPQEKMANEFQYKFVCGTLKEETFHVLKFEGNESISSLYRFEITLQSSIKNIAAADLINKPATLFIYRMGEYVPFSGVISDFAYTGETIDNACYTAILMPKLAMLDCQVQTRIFQKKSYTDIIKEVLDLDGLQSYYKLDVSQTLPPQDFVLQYQESDLNFISRLMEAVGSGTSLQKEP